MRNYLVYSFLKIAKRNERFWAADLRGLAHGTVCRLVASYQNETNASTMLARQWVRRGTSRLPRNISSQNDVIKTERWLRDRTSPDRLIQTSSAVVGGGRNRFADRRHC